MEVYVIIETIDGESSIGGVYSSYRTARSRAMDVAEYAGWPQDGKNVWGEDSSNKIEISTHEVQNA